MNRIPEGHKGRNEKDAREKNSCFNKPQKTGGIETLKHWKRGKFH
jgi:hypothetical protein